MQSISGNANRAVTGSDADLEKLLTAWLPARRWFRSKARPLARVHVEARAEARDREPFLCVARAEFRAGPPERYALPLALLDPDAETLPPEPARVGMLGTPEGPRLLCDASWDARFHAALYETFAGAREIRLGEGALRGHPAIGAFGAGGEAAPAEARMLGAEQSNTAFFFPGSSDPLVRRPARFAKLYRRLEEGIHPEPEVLRHLRERAAYAHVPKFESSLVWERTGHPPVTVALMQEWVAGQGDAWEYTLKNLPHPSGAFLEWVGLAGRRVAALHAALASTRAAPAPDPDFDPEPLEESDLERVRRETRALLDAALDNLEARRAGGEYSSLNRDAQNIISEVLAGRRRLGERLERRLPGSLNGAVKIRTHGDLHLGQILVGAQEAAPGAASPDLWILDFEGEPGRPLADARRKQSPLRDVAGMMRSFHYAAHTVLRSGAAADLANRLCRAFRQGYAEEANSGEPRDAGAGGLLDLFVFEKTVYELHYELNNRPDWVEIPLRGLIEPA